MASKAIVLAAGRGGRLEGRTAQQPKCLVPVAGRPLIYHVLAALACAGIAEAVVVLGYRGDDVEAALGDGSRFGMRLRYAWNHDYSRGNASSLSCALQAVGPEPFLLVMADHLCSASLLQAFLERVDGRCALAVDRSDLGTERIAEATKVALAGPFVLDIGKGLGRWDAVDTGVSHWTAGAFAALQAAGPEGELAALMARMAGTEGGALAACDVSGHFWLDVDTEDDLRLADELLQADERRLA